MPPALASMRSAQTNRLRATGAPCRVLIHRKPPASFTKPRAVPGDIFSAIFSGGARYHVEAFPVVNPRTRWGVPMAEEQAFRARLDEIFMTAEARAALSDPANSGAADGIYAVFPPAFVISSLTEDS